MHIQQLLQQCRRPSGHVWKSHGKTLAAIESIYDLYSEFLRHACRSTLAHESRLTELESFTYMLWDVSPLSSLAMMKSPDGSWPLLRVLERVLYLPHNGCIESALHGLGHMVHYRGDQVIPTIIDRFVAATPGLHPHLKQYASAARVGHVQ